MGRGGVAGAVGYGGGELDHGEAPGVSELPGILLRVSASRHAFNPLDRVELGRSVGRALLLRPCEALPPQRFEGAGIYALYYQGNFDAYQPVALAGCEWPIYVGRAMPAGARKGLIGLDAPAGRKLYQRLRQHHNSIKAVKNLNETDFRCRYLVVADIWIPLAEQLLIGHYRPLWNGVVDGFGGHAPGGTPGGTVGRAGQQKSAWDTLHPGRPFAKGRPAQVRPAAIRARIAEHLAAHPPKTGEPPALDEPLWRDVSEDLGGTVE